MEPQKPHQWSRWQVRLPKSQKSASLDSMRQTVFKLFSRELSQLSLPYTKSHQRLVCDSQEHASTRPPISGELATAGQTHSWNHYLSWSSTLSLPLEIQKAKRWHPPAGVSAGALASGREHASSARVQACCWGVRHTPSAASPALLQAENAASLSLCSLRHRQRLLLSCIPVTTTSTHTLSMRAGGWDRLGQVPFFQRFSGKWFFLSGRRKRQRDIFRGSRDMIR